MKLKNKKALEMSFAWIFAIAVGAIIIVLAIYFAANLVKSGYNEGNTRAARELVNVLDPLQTSVEDGKAQRIELIDETRIYNYCEKIGDFGSNKIEVSERNRFGGEGWTRPGGDIKTESQYLFSENTIEGKSVYFFIKPFKSPFKAADLMVMYSENYCFVNPPEDIKTELEGLTNDQNSNIDIKNNLIDCQNSSVSVCFTSGRECDVIVEGNCNSLNCESVYDSGTVIKDDGELTYTDGLLYSAIFSSKEIYECNINRIMKRVNYLSELYIEKSKFVSVRGCGTNLQVELTILSELSKNLEDSSGLLSIKAISDEINDKNIGVCRLF